MTHRTLVLVLTVAAALAVGTLLGYRLRVSQEEVFVYPRRMLPPVPPELAVYEPPAPSPTPIVGLHEYAAPLRVAPTASPKPDRASRSKSRPEATHTRAWSGRGTIRVRGYATWYATGPSGLFAAAGPTLRRALGPGWRGSRVLVCHSRACVEVKLIDWCACGARHGVPTVLDLSDEAFAEIARLGSGVVRVVVEGFR
jgi:hypothetical protein